MESSMKTTDALLQIANEKRQSDWARTTLIGASKYAERLENELWALKRITASIPIDQLSTLCDAWRDGRCMILPCKVGDTVYEALLEWDCTECLKTSFKPKVRERKVTHFMFGKSGDIIVGVAGDGADYLIYGKTVFLAREEAEDALKEVAKNERQHKTV